MTNSINSNSKQDAKVVFDQGLKMGFKMNILDIGGGYPGTSNPVVSFDEISNVISHTLDNLFPVNYVENLEIIAEPGRYYAASVFTLATQIIAKKTCTYNNEEIQMNSTVIENDGLLKFKPNLIEEQQSTEQIMKNVDEKHGVMYYLNDGVYGSFNCTVFDYTQVNPQPYYLNNDENAVKMSKLNYLKTTLWGPTCDSLDMIRKDIYLPEMEIGDWIIFREMGAYTIASASNGFNGFKIPQIKYYLDNYTIKTLKNLVCWPRIYSVLMKIEKKEQDEIDLFEINLISAYNELKQLKHLLPNHKVKDMTGLIPVH